MTVSAGALRSDYIGDGSIVEFALGFQALDENDIVVYLTDPSDEENPVIQVLTTDYTVSGTLSSGSGIVTFVTAPAANYVVTFLRDIALTQGVDYDNYDNFPAETHERALDKLTMICQQFEERMNRMPAVPESITLDSLQFPAPSAGKAIIWDDSAAALTNGPTATDIAAVQSNAAVATAAAAAASDSQTAAAASATEAAASAASIPEIESLLRADTPDILEAAFGDDVQVYTGTDLSGLTVNRNHVSWTLTASSQFSADVTLPYAGTYVFHVYPSSNTLTLSASYKTNGSLPDPDSAAGEIRIVVEYFNSRLTIVSLQNMEA